MEFEQKINEEMKAAMKSGDKLRLETIRSLRAGILSFKTSGADHEMNEDDVQKILLSEAKKRKDAIEMYKQGGRTDLSDKESAELKIIEEFLPKQMSDDEIREFVNKLVAEIGAEGPQQMGKVMGPAMKQLRGKADGNAVQAIVKEILSK
ncbi:MAG: GatB/YqeY domain-containing protein [Candidatus Kapabacteria bacterium]|nr:GatB/YqeY domain-containing protein [Candidatus Kapabacteria bacterium]